MALLTRGLPPLLLTLVLAACAEAPSDGVFEMEVRGQGIQQVAGRALVSWLLSSRPSGLYLYLEGRGEDGVVTALELDVAPGDTGQGHLSLREYRAGRVVFSSDRATGTVALPPGPECRCQDGYLSLSFTAAGPDGQAGTQDDEIRWIPWASFSRTDRFCRDAPWSEPRSELVVFTLACPAWALESGESPPREEVGVWYEAGYDDPGDDSCAGADVQESAGVVYVDEGHGAGGSGSEDQDYRDHQDYQDYQGEGQRAGSDEDQWSSGEPGGCEPDDYSDDDSGACDREAEAATTGRVPHAGRLRLGLAEILALVVTVLLVRVRSARRPTGTR